MNKKFNPIVEDIFLLKCLYIISFPLARLFANLRIHPNKITTISNITILISIYFLSQGSIVLFIVFWIFAEIFDICDGTVARINRLASESGAFYDHFSDQVKIFLFFIIVSFYFKNEIITYLAFISSGIFFLYIDVSKRVEIFKLKYPREGVDIDDSTKSLIRKIYNHVFLIHGHTMVLIPFFVIDLNFAIVGLSIFILVATKNLFGALRAQLKLFKKY
jgi:phosphatidylglycerophosphate synthase